MNNKKFIWTNHASRRLNERKIHRKYIDALLRNPDHIFNKENNVKELQKKFDGRTFAAIIKSNGQGESIILSCWVNPPFPGTTDYKRRQRYFAKQKATPLKKLWFSLLDLLGL